MAGVFVGVGFGLFEWPRVFACFWVGFLYAASALVVARVFCARGPLGTAGPTFLGVSESSERRLVKNSWRSSRMSFHSSMRPAWSEQSLGFWVRWRSRRCWMMGMIWAGVGFGPGVPMKRRLQRALRYGTSRVASRAASSSTFLGNGISDVSMNFIRSFRFG